MGKEISLNGCYFTDRTYSATAFSILQSISGQSARLQKFRYWKTLALMYVCMCNEYILVWMLRRRHQTPCLWSYWRVRTSWYGWYGCWGPNSCLPDWAACDLTHWVTCHLFSLKDLGISSFISLSGRSRLYISAGFVPVCRLSCLLLFYVSCSWRYQTQPSLYLSVGCPRGGAD